jgi:hypothetical protein
MLFEVTAKLHFLGFDLLNISEGFEASDKQAAQEKFVEKYRRARIKQLPGLLDQKKNQHIYKYLISKPPNATVLSCQNFSIRPLSSKNPKKPSRNIPGYGDTLGTEEDVNHKAIPVTRFDLEEDEQTLKEYRRQRFSLKPSTELS